MVNNKLENRLKDSIKQNKYLVVNMYNEQIESLSRLLFISNIDYKISYVHYVKKNYICYNYLNKWGYMDCLFLYIHDKKEMNRLITCFNTLGIYNKNRFNFIRQMVWKYLDRS